MLTSPASSTGPVTFPWKRPTTALAWQSELRDVQQRRTHLLQSVQWAQAGGVLLCLANAFPLSWLIHLALSFFLAALFLYGLGVDRLIGRLDRRLVDLAKSDPDPSQLTRWQSRTDLVQYRQTCLASGVPLLEGDAQWMDRQLLNRSTP